MGDIIAHFETGRYNRNTTFLEDAEYGRALDSFCKGCADILLQDSGSGEVLLAGDTPLAAARKNVLREAGLDLPTSSFKPLCVVSMLWQKRKQPPADNGTADVSVVYLAQVTPEERASVTLDAAEHAAARWVAPEAVAAGNEYHPALRRGAQHIAVAACQAALEAAAGAGAADAEVARRARALVAATGAARAMEALPVPFSLMPGEPASG